MLQIIGFESLKKIIVHCIMFGQANPFENPETIAEIIIKELKKKNIRRVK